MATARIAIAAIERHAFLRESILYYIAKMRVGGAHFISAVCRNRPIEDGKKLAEGPGGAGRAPVETEHDIEARAIPFLRHSRQGLTASDCQQDRTDDRLVLPTDQNLLLTISATSCGSCPTAYVTIGVRFSRAASGVMVSNRRWLGSAPQGVSGLAAYMTVGPGKSSPPRLPPNSADQSPARCQPRITRDFLSTEPPEVKPGPGQDSSGFSACRMMRIVEHPRSQGSLRKGHRARNQQEHDL